MVTLTPIKYVFFFNDVNFMQQKSSMIKINLAVIYFIVIQSESDINSQGANRDLTTSVPFSQTNVKFTCTSRLVKKGARYNKLSCE